MNKPNRFSRRWGFFGCAGAVLVLAAGCDGRPPETDPAQGRIALSAAANEEVGGFQFDVTDPAGMVIASRFVAQGSGPGAMSTDTFFALPPGAYVATATAVSAPNVPVGACSPASDPVTIASGQTSEVTLVVRCRPAGRGGLGVTVRLNYEPEITGLSFAPSRTVGRCQPITIDVEAVDREHDPLTYQFAVVSAPAGAPAGSFTVDVSGPRATVVATVAGDYLVEAKVCDPLGCVKLTFPLHIVEAASAGGTCGPVCDDRNPCTTDSVDSAGLCSHVTVPDGAVCTGGKLRVKLLGFNDFHGQIEAGRRVANRPVGGAAVMASYLKNAQAGLESQTVIVHAGDHVGASPPASALLQDEPSIAFLNALANPDCAVSDRLNPACNIVGALGNHEFDEGKTELLRLVGGGNHPSGPFLEDPYLGARYPMVSANVVDELTNQPILPPYVIKTIRGLPVAFIGAVLKTTPTVVTPTGVAGLRFLDEADAVNAYVPELKARGVRAIVLTIHQGGTQTSYNGPTMAGATTINGRDILDIVDRLDDEIDVVVSGHSHAFTNALLPNQNGKPILITQAFSSSTAYADIDLLIDPVTGDVVSKTAQIVTTFGDAGPGLTPDPTIAAFVDVAVSRVAPLVNRLVGFTPVAITQTANAAGESTMGNLIADAQRAAMSTEMAFMNPGGIRANLDAGDITWGELFTVQPFGNNLVRMNLTGAQIYQLLEQQWLGQPFTRQMQISGLSYTWDPALPVGGRVVEVRRGGVPIDRAASYSITCNSFMATGGDNFTVFLAGTDPVGGPIDLDALVEYVEAHTPLNVVREDRIVLR